jgi:hypothetical protein
MDPITPSDPILAPPATVQPVPALVTEDALSAKLLDAHKHVGLKETAYHLADMARGEAGKLLDKAKADLAKATEALHLFHRSKKQG